MYYLGTVSELTQILPANVSISPTSRPLTDGEVASIIFEVEAELDGYAAAAGYSVPVSTAATYAFGTMQLQTKNGAGARVLGILFPNMGGPGGKATLATDYQTAYMTFVRSLRDGKVALVGAGLSGGEEARALPRAGAAASQTVPFDWTP